jgi:adenylosuccinate synthase
MTTTALIGLQWGDEGKGKMVDLFARDVDCVVRCQGGSNAGHTVYIGDERIVLQLVPSGILVPGVLCVIGNGVVIDPEQLLKEIDGLAARGIAVEGRLAIADRAHLVFPHHKLLDRTQEDARGAAGIGTTLRGIGPAYEDKVARTGIRVADLVHEDRLRERVRVAVAEKRPRLGALADQLESEDAFMARLRVYRDRLAPMITDTVALVHEQLRARKRVLLEGAQGSLLDIDLGSYPFVTSSNTNVGGLLSGSGVPASAITSVIGITKAYSTRVGAGPYPTELKDATGDLLRARGREFGAITGRPRRCGWLDMVLVRFACEVNGVTELALTKADILSGFDELRVCNAYRIGGKTVTRPPSSPEDLAIVEPVYETLPGWKEDISGCRRYDALPEALRRYVELVEQACGARIRWVSVGPTREAIIARS